MLSAVYWPSDQGEIILLSSRKYPKWPMLLGAQSPIIAVWGEAGDSGGLYWRVLRTRCVEGSRGLGFRGSNREFRR